MKIRIKIVTHKNGSQLFYPQVKKWFIWRGVDANGILRDYNISCTTKDEALESLRKYIEGNRSEKEVEFENYYKDLTKINELPRTR